MGCCRDCLYFEEGEGFLGLDRCRYLGKTVSSSASCSHFFEKPTKSNSGYSACFLTSACVEYFGMEDNCYELQTLRAFRDSYMRKTEEGSKLVDEYYKLAPDIVKRIDSSDKKDDYYKHIYKVVNKCVGYIKQGKNELAQEEYINLVNEYKALLDKNN